MADGIGMSKRRGSALKPGRSPDLALALALAAVLALTACGKVGPPQPIGPADKVTWPHSYPTPHPAP
jgi:predicted small lipoprotein YifL